MGYEKVHYGYAGKVAQFSIRGGIVDIYGFGMASPARLEWWGDDLEIHPFLSTRRASDPVTQAR